MLAKNGKPTTFITLTVNPAREVSPASRARALTQAWPIVVRRAKKKYGYPSIPYLCVFEATKRGEPHLHILCRVKWIDQKWLSNQMRELTGAPIVDIREVKSAKQVANYISKYIGKEPHRFETCKRYWSTRSWLLVRPVLEEIDGFWSTSWEVREVDLAWLEECWMNMGYAVRAEGHMLVGRARAPPLRRFEDATIK